MRAALASTILAVTIASPATLDSARAQGVPIVAPSSLADAMATVSAYADELKQVDQTLTNITSLFNIQHVISAAIGSVGSGIPNFTGAIDPSTSQTIGQIISVAGMGMQTYTNAKNSYESILADISTIKNLAMNLQNGFSITSMVQSQFGNLGSLNAQNAYGMINEISTLNSAMSNSETLTQANYDLDHGLFAQTTTPSDVQTQRINVMRRSFAEQSSMAGLMTAASTTSSMTGPSVTDLTLMASTVGAAETSRADIQSNSATEIKMLEQIQAQTGVMARLLRLRADNSVSSLNTIGATYDASNSTTGQ